MSEKTVFISYRRDVAGRFFARAIKEALTHHGYDVFLDVDCIDAGKWAEQILTQVPRRAHFLLLLTPGALDRCAQEDDWVRNEFLNAVETGRNIVPVREESVDIAQLRNGCVECMHPLFEYQIATIQNGNFEADVTRLKERYVSPEKAPKDPGSDRPEKGSISVDISRAQKFVRELLIGREQEMEISGDAWGRFQNKLIEKICSLAGERAKDTAAKSGEMLNEGDLAKIKIEARAAWGKVEWGRAAAEYRQRMRKDYNQMRILGMAGPVPLDNVFTDVFVLNRITADRRLTVEQLLQQQDTRVQNHGVKRRLAVEVVKTHTRLFLLGKPGAGKTTMMKWLVIQCTDGKLKHTPIFVTLKEWADSGEPDLLDFIARQFKVHGFPDARLFVETLLREGGAMVLLDGLDEVNLEGGRREGIIQRVKDFAKTFPHSRCVVTCRVAATDYQFEDFMYVELADFSPEQAECFANNWFRQDPAKAKGFSEEFRKPENRDLRDLGRTPLLLTLLCLNYEETLHFPRRRVEIYEEAMDALLKKWDLSRGIKRDETYRDLSLGHKRLLLSRLAAETFEKGEIFFRKDEVEGRIMAFLGRLPRANAPHEGDGAVVLQSIEAQHGLMITRARGIVSFSHKTFHEYLTAKHIEKNPVPAVLRGLAEHGHDDGWHEVLMMTASLLEPEQADTLFETWGTAERQALLESTALQSLTIWAARKANLASEQIGGRTAVWQAYYVALALARDWSPGSDRITDRDRAVIGAAELVRKLSDYGARTATPVANFHLSWSKQAVVELVARGGPCLEWGLTLLSREIQWVAGAPLSLAREFVSDYLEIRENLPVEAIKLRESWILPPTIWSHERWWVFLNEYYTLLQHHVDLAHDFKLTVRDVGIIKRLLWSSLRMFKCLEVASVSDRERILNNVFSLPKAG